MEWKRKWMTKEYMIRQRLTFDSITEAISNEWLEDIKKEAGDESQNKWTTLKDSNDKKNDDSTVLP